MLATDLHVEQIASTYRRFAQEIGEARWRRVAADRRQDSKANALLRDYFAREFDIVFQLDFLGGLLERYGALPSSLADLRPIYGAAGFAAQILSLLAVWPARDADNLRQRVRGALKEPSDMRALRLELSVATHFLHRRWSVSWPEVLHVPGETFDLLVEPPGVSPLEVECKSIGEDKGRRIPRREVLDFYRLLQPHLKPTLGGLRTGLSVAMTVPRRLPEAYRDRAALAQTLGRAIFQATSCTLSDGTDILISDFNVALLGDQPHSKQPHELRRTVEGITATRNSPAVLVGARAGGAIALAVQSARDDLFLKATFDTLSDAARDQLTGRRAGMLVAAFDGIGAGELRSVAEDDNSGREAPSALQLSASRFLSSSTRDHIVGLAFFSKSSIQPVERGMVDATGGLTYYFPKKESPLWNDAHSGLFADRLSR